MAGGAPLRVAIIGYGLSGRVFHAPLIQAAPGLVVSAVVTADPVRRAQAAADMPQAHLLGSPQELWAQRGSHDLVVVATATATHTALTLEALRAGLPAVVEKPLAPTFDEAHAIVDAVGRQEQLVVPFHNRRWDSDQLTLKRLMAEGALGEVRRYESRFERWRPVITTAGWRETLGGDRGGGVLLDLGVHLVDQAVELFGPVRSVHAEIDARRSVADDDVFMALSHARGVHSHLWASAVCAAPGPRLRVLGSQAAFVAEHLDGQEDSLRSGATPATAGFGVEPEARWGSLRRGDGTHQVPVPAERGRWDSFYPAVAAAVRGEAPPPVVLEDALSVLEVLEAARRSARSGQAVSLG